MQSFTSFKTHSHHFPIIPLHNCLILPTHPRTKRPQEETTYFICSHSLHSRLIHIIFHSFPFIFVSFYLHTPVLSDRKGETTYFICSHSRHSQVIHLILDSFISFQSQSYHSRVIHIIFQSFPFIFVSFYRHTPVLSDRRGKQLISYVVIHVILRSFISFQTHSYHLTVIHIILRTFVSFQTHSYHSHHSTVIHLILDSILSFNSHSSHSRLIYII